MRTVAATATTRAYMPDGQSLGFMSTYTDAFAAFAISMQASGLANYDRTAYFADPATGPEVTNGASMLQRFEAIDDRYWRTNAGGAGPLQTSKVASISAWNAATGPTNGPIRLIDWDQGQADASESNGTLVVADGNEFRDQTVACVLALRTAASPAAIGDCKVVIRPLGKSFNADLSNRPPSPNANIIRDAQLQVLSTFGVNARQVETWDVPLYDGFHPDHIGYRNIGYRVAMMLQEMLGVAGVNRGPAITSIVRSGNTIVITITPEGINTLVKPATPCGFGFYNGATRVIPTSWAWAGNQLIATFPSSPAGYLVRFLDGYITDWAPDRVIRYVDAPMLHTGGLDGLIGLPLLSRLPVTVT